MTFQQFAFPRPLKRAESSKKLWNYHVFVIPIFALLDGSRAFTKADGVSFAKCSKNRLIFNNLLFQGFSKEYTHQKEARITTFS